MIYSTISHLRREDFSGNFSIDNVTSIFREDTFWYNYLDESVVVHFMTYSIA